MQEKFQVGLDGHVGAGAGIEAEKATFYGSLGNLRSGYFSELVLQDAWCSSIVATSEVQPVW